MAADGPDTAHRRRRSNGRGSRVMRDAGLDADWR